MSVPDANGSFANFYAEQRPLLVSLAYRMVRDRQLAEDIVNDAATRVWRRCQAELPDEPVAFLVRAVQNEARDHFRRRARRPQITPLSPRHEQWQGRSDPDVALFEDRDTIAHLLHLLPDRQRTAVELRYLHGWSDAEIAARLGMALPTVRSNVHRALQRLRTCAAAT